MNIYNEIEKFKTNRRVIFSGLLNVDLTALLLNRSSESNSTSNLTIVITLNVSIHVRYKVLDCEFASVLIMFN